MIYALKNTIMHDASRTQNRNYWLTTTELKIVALHLVQAYDNVPAKERHNVFPKLHLYVSATRKDQLSFTITANIAVRIDYYFHLSRLSLRHF